MMAHVHDRTIVVFSWASPCPTAFIYWQLSGYDSCRGPGSRHRFAIMVEPFVCWRL